MNVSLTPELEALVKDKVKTGLYNSSSEVIREALRVWNEEAKYQEKLQALRERLEIGERQLDAGEYANYDLEKIKKELFNKVK